MIDVSIILPVYNRENTIKDSIESIINQTYSNWELIIVNDGSEDNSEKICRKYAIEDNRIKIINQENNGPSSARNNGISVAKGKFIMFIDSDDQYELDMIEKMINKMIQNNSKLVVCNYKKDTDVEGFEEMELFLAMEVLQRNRIFNLLWNKIYDLKLIKEKNIIFDESIERGEDYRFNIDYCRYIEKVTFINQVLYKYKVQLDSLTKKYREDEFELSISNLEYNIKFCIDENINISKYLKEQYFNILKITCLSIAAAKKRLRDKKNKIEEIINYLKKENILFEDIRLKSKEDSIIRFLARHKMTYLIIIYSKIRNFIKKIIK